MKPMNPSISFITPVFNTIDYLEDCIQSVIHQTSDGWELILIDDGSTDGSGRICDQYAAVDDRIKVIHKENSGQFDSRMKGIYAANGLYCTGLDSDDYIDEDCVKRLLEAVQLYKADVFCWNMRIVTEDKSFIRNSVENPRKGVISKDDLLYEISKSANHSFCNKLIKRELLINGKYGDKTIRSKHAEDYILIAPALCMAKEAVLLSDYLYNYRQINQSVTHSDDVKSILDYLDSTMRVMKIFRYYQSMSPVLDKLERITSVGVVGDGLKQVYRNGNISKSEEREIRSHEMYHSLKEVERIKYTSTSIYCVLKLFRYRLSFLLKLFYGLKRKLA